MHITPTVPTVHHPLHDHAIDAIDQALIPLRKKFIPLFIPEEDLKLYLDSEDSYKSGSGADSRASSEQKLSNPV